MAKERKAMCDIPKLLIALGKRYTSEGHELITDCPYCGKAKHFAINELNGYFRCRRCGRYGAEINLWADEMGITLEKGGYAFKKQLVQMVSQVENVSEEQAKALLGDTSRREQEEQKDLGDFIADEETRDTVYRALLSLLKLDWSCRNDLLKRGLTDREIIDGLFKSTVSPQSAGGKEAAYSKAMYIAKEVVRITGMEPRGVPGFYRHNGKWTFMITFGSAYFVPYLNSEGQVIALQYRLMHPEKKENGKEKSKYRQFSSRYKQDGARGRNRVSWAYDEEIDARHPVRYLFDIPDDAVVVTEGPLKGYVAQIFVGGTFLSLTGIDSLNLLPEQLKRAKELGYKQLWNALDMDEFGTHPNKDVERASEKIKQMAERAGLSYRRLQWEVKLKGIDDYALTAYQLRWAEATSRVKNK